MIGVIVWSSAAKSKAVIWCEDQGALAYLHGAGKLVQGHEWPEAGDMVELETEVQNGLRHAFNVRIVTERRCRELPELLRDVGTDKGRATARPALRVVASQEHPVACHESRDIAGPGKAPGIFALTAGRKRL